MCRVLQVARGDGCLGADGNLSDDEIPVIGPRRELAWAVFTRHIWRTPRDEGVSRQ
jgi:hypothetical protein